MAQADSDRLQRALFHSPGHSLRYHNLKPDYIHERLRCLGRTFALQILLLQVDVVRNCKWHPPPTLPPMLQPQVLHHPPLRPTALSLLQKDPHKALKELAKICILADCTLVLAWR